MTGLLAPPVTDRAPLSAAETVEVSVVMPCLDEAAAVGECVALARATLARLGLDGEVLVVDNGSRDGSPAVAAAAGARVVHEPRRGYGAAYLRGFAEARGRYLVLGDADGSYDFGALGDFVEPLRRGEADVVMGSRFAGRILPGAMPWLHRFVGNPILSGLLRLLFHTSVSDAHCGMRALSRAAVERLALRTTGMELASEMVVAAVRADLRIVERPITYHPRAGESKLQSFRDAWRHLRFMLMLSPSWLYLGPGLLLMLGGGALAGLLAGGPRELFGRVWDFHVLLLAMAALTVGYSLVLFDICAKAFCLGAGLPVGAGWLRRLPRWFTLERGLVVGALLFFGGLGLEAWIALGWLSRGAGALMAVRGVGLGATAMVLGAQTVFASFLVSLMLTERR